MSVQQTPRLTGAHRPPRAEVRAAIRAALADLDPGARVLVALSGGPDSLALCSGTVRVGSREGWLVAAAIVDHGLQPGSAAVAATAKVQAELLGCAPCWVLPVQVTPDGSGLEAAARQARYEALARCAQEWGAVTVLLGHTREDQAETVLMRLARGAGTRSLSGMAVQSGDYRRPLLGLAREVVAGAAAADARDDPRLTPWIDPQNSQARFTRARVRSELLPLLTDILGAGAVLGLCRTAEMARADADALDAIAAARLSQLLPCLSSANVLSTANVQASADIRGSADVRPAAGVDPGGHPGQAGDLPPLPPAVGAEPAAIASRMLRMYLIAAGCPADQLTRDHVTQVGHLLGTTSRTTRVWLPGGRIAQLTAAGLTLTDGGA